MAIGRTGASLFGAYAGPARHARQTSIRGIAVVRQPSSMRSVSIPTSERAPTPQARVGGLGRGGSWWRLSEQFGDRGRGACRPVAGHRAVVDVTADLLGDRLCDRRWRRVIEVHSLASAVTV